MHVQPVSSQTAASQWGQNWTFIQPSIFHFFFLSQFLMDLLVCLVMFQVFTCFRFVVRLTDRRTSHNDSDDLDDKNYNIYFARGINYVLFFFKVL